MATKIIKFNNGTYTYAPVTVASAVQYSYDGGVMSVQDAIGTIASTVISSNHSISDEITEHKTNKVNLSYSTTYGIYPTGVHGNGTGVKINAGTGINITNSGTTLTVSATHDHTSGSDNQYLSASATGNVATISLNGGGGSVNISNNGSSSAGSNNAHVAISYSSTNGIQLKVTYTDTNTHNSHALSFTPGTDTTPTVNSVKVISGFQPAAASSGTISTSYTTYSLPTQKYVDDTFVTKTTFESFTTTGMRYMGSTGTGTTWTAPKGTSQGDVYIVGKAGHGNSSSEVGDFIVYNGSTWDIWDKNVTKAASFGSTSIADNKMVVTDGDTGLVKTATIPTSNVTSRLVGENVAGGKQAKIHNYEGSSSNSNILFDGGSGVGITYASSKLTITYTPDHTGAGTANRLAWWTSGSYHTAYTGNWGSSTKYAYIESGVLKEGTLPTFTNSNDFAAITAGTDSTDVTAGTVNTSTATADAVGDTLTVQGGNKWITTGTSDTSNADKLFINHALKGNDGTAALKKIAWDEAGHIGASADVTITKNLKYDVYPSDVDFTLPIGNTESTGNTIVTNIS